VIRFDHVSVTYPHAAQPSLTDVVLHIPEGELCLVVGRTGAGKSTLLRAINGLVPHFTGGQVAGRVTVAGRDTRTHHPRDLADVVGVVLQDPRQGFVTDTVEDELAFGMESLGLPPDNMRRRVEETLDLLGLAELRHRPLRTLSGGQRQRVAIGSVLATHPQVLVLDEPTSALDPGAAEDVLAALHRLVHDLGLTVVVAEHRLERVVHLADRVVQVNVDGRVVDGDPATLMLTAPVAPPVVELGRFAGWVPLPLSVRQARRAAGPLRERLAAHHPKAHLPSPAPDALVAATCPVAVTGLSAGYGDRPVLSELDLLVSCGEVVALMGRNGSGKTTLLHALVGVVPVSGGRVRVHAVDPATTGARDLPQHVGLVPQDADDLLWAESVVEECTTADRDAHAAPGTTIGQFDLLAPGVDPHQHPHDLSQGQRLALALAVILAADPPVVLLDEPTRGLDYPAKRRLVDVLRQRAADGVAVVVATHDVELVAELASRTVVLADGDVVADGPTASVIASSPQYAPQIAKVLAPQAWLTVDDVTGALQGAAS
jgi:energy-coupling factor transporter ATP-binding protein EcfA2